MHGVVVGCGLIDPIRVPGDGGGGHGFGGQIRVGCDPFWVHKAREGGHWGWVGVGHDPLTLPQVCRGGEGRYGHWGQYGHVPTDPIYVP